jgi:hypothetical protein
MPHRTIVSFATPDGDYIPKLARLRASVEASGFDGVFHGWTTETLPGGCPDHLTVPFAFKPLAIDAVRRGGGRFVLWMDAACVVVQPLDGLFEEIATCGCVLFQNGMNRVGEWISDPALARVGVSRDAAMRMPEVNAAVMGFDLAHPVATAFLDRWLAEARDGLAFRGVAAPYPTMAAYREVKWNHRGLASADARVRGHRHDQSVAGVIAAELGIVVRPAGLATADGRAPDARTIVVIDRDLARSAAARVVLAAMRRRPSIRRAMRFARRAWPFHRSPRRPLS